MAYNTTFGIPAAHGRVIGVFMILDTEGTESGPGYDNILHEPKPVKRDAGDKIGKAGRTELSEFKIRVQENSFPTDRLEQTRQGKERQQQRELIIDYRELENRGMIDSNGECKIRTGTRLDRFEDRGGNTVEKFNDPPGLYVDWIEYVRSGPKIREVMIRVEPRRQSRTF